MVLRSLKDIDVAGRRVFLRVDYNVPLTPAGGIADPTRIDATLPTVRLMLDKGARLVLATHLGRPRGRPDARLSVEPLAAYLADSLGREIVLADEPAGDGARKVVTDLREGQIGMLENLRFSPGEHENDDTFARTLAGYGEVYVNDAFACLHNNHASTAVVPRHFRERGMGLLMERELAALGRLLEKPERPFAAVIGGTGAGPKLAVMEALLDRVDAMFVGGVVANTFLAARGARLSRSQVDEDKVASARILLRKADARDVRIHLPRDLVAGAGVHAATGRVAPAYDVPEDLAALDIGPETALAYANELRRARTVFWNGPMGVFDAEPFASGTLEVAKALSQAFGALTVVSGGDTVAATRRAGVQDRISHLSTGGAACLRYLEGRPLPSLTALAS
jgi:phosphoglycerate kinase